tara:strand:- start:66 stop:1529 length:1464 start_codon:yes stop_codon:yes gene_type:complete
MRRKPLNSNPNSMHMIMENFRRFTDTTDVMGSNIDTSRIYLFENNSKAPTSERPFADLLEEYKKDIIDEDILFEQWDRSVQYEYSIIITEGILDALKKPVQAFANSKLAMAAKKKARQALSVVAAKLFSGAVKIIRAILAKAKSIEKLIVSTVGSASGGKINQGKIGKLYEKGVGLVNKATKKLAGLAQKLITTVLKVLTHPLFKAAVIVVCCGILVLAVFNAALFVGAMAAAPALATRRLGAKGAMAFWKMIPNAPAAAMAESIKTLKVAGKILLKEVDESIIAQALASIAQDIPEGSFVEEDIANFVTIDADEVTGEVEGLDMAWFETSDQALTDDLSAIRTLQMELADPGSSGFDLDKLMTLSQQADDTVLKTVQHALQVAKKTCAEDPDMCQASEILAKDFEVLRTDNIASEFSDYVKVVSQDDNVTEAWENVSSKLSGEADLEVSKNPFYDPESAPRAPAEKGGMSQIRKIGGKAVKGPYST